MELTLVIPDLIPSQPAGALVDVYRDLAVPDLAFLLARAQRRAFPGIGLETWLGRHFGLGEDDELPVAALSLLAEHGDPGEAYWLCVDPVHLEPHRDQLVLGGPETLAIGRTEADALVAMLNAHFSGHGISFHHIRPDRWYARLTKPLALRTHPLPEVSGHSINALMPAGPDGGRLRRLMNDVQMLLHAHPVNRAREAQGQPTVNSIWPWGGGRLPAVEARPFDHVWADDLLAQGLALASHTPCAELPANGHVLLEAAEADNHLVVLDGLRAAAARGEAEVWRRALRNLEEKWFKPLAQAFRKGRLTGLVILALGRPHGMRFELAPRARWKFWRRARPLAHYAGLA